MALYNFHRVLIAAAILFDLGFSLYCFRNYRDSGDAAQLAMLVASSLVTIGLVAYLIHFNRGLTVLRSLLAPQDGHCGHCGHDLRETLATPAARCPACGTPLGGAVPEQTT